MRPRRSGGLFVTFLLGSVVGSAVTYGLLSAAGVALPDPTLNPGAVSSDPALPVPEATTDELADLNGLWPARHLVCRLFAFLPIDVYCGSDDRPGDRRRTVPVGGAPLLSRTANRIAQPFAVDGSRKA